MPVDIQNLQHIFRIDKKKIVRFAEAILEAMGEHRAELSLVFVNDLYIKGLNYKYRNVDFSTDVLAFGCRDEACLVHTNLQYRKLYPPLFSSLQICWGKSNRRDGSKTKQGGRRKSSKSCREAIFLLGDVVISTQTAKREAKKRKVFVQKEIELYLTHGILHLLGYDDENRRDRKKMRAKERELLLALSA